jgi:hypothetical protein
MSRPSESREKLKKVRPLSDAVHLAEGGWDGFSFGACLGSRER